MENCNFFEIADHNYTALFSIFFITITRICMLSTFSLYYTNLLYQEHLKNYPWVVRLTTQTGQFCFFVFVFLIF